MCNIMSIEDIGKAIAKRRQDLAMTQSELANRTRVSRPRISAIENGTFRGRLTDLLVVLAELQLDISASPLKRPTFEDLAAIFGDDDD